MSFSFSWLFGESYFTYYELAPLLRLLDYASSIGGNIEIPRLDFAPAIGGKIEFPILLESKPVGACGFGVLL